MRTLREEILFAGGGQRHLTGVRVAQADLFGCSGGIAGRMEPNWEKAGEEGLGERTVAAPPGRTGQVQPGTYLMGI